MKVQLTIFALFLVGSVFSSTRLVAQHYTLLPTNELEASQQAYRLGEAIRMNEARTSEVQKGANRSIDAMHWTALSVDQPSQFKPANTQKPMSLGKGLIFKANAYKPLVKSAKLQQKPVYN